jgi:hypothetical protein
MFEKVLFPIFVSCTVFICLSQELNQLEKYCSFVNFENDEEYYKMVDLCENDSRPKVVWNCAANIVSEMNYKPLFILKGLQSSLSFSEGRIINIDVKDAEKTKRPPKGGSSIGVVGLGPILHTCSLYDHFNDSYRIDCINNYNNSILFVTLDFEYFDAFSEIYANIEDRSKILRKHVAVFESSSDTLTNLNTNVYEKNNFEFVTKGSWKHLNFSNTSNDLKTKYTSKENLNSKDRSYLSQRLLNVNDKNNIDKNNDDYINFKNDVIDSNQYNQTYIKNNLSNKKEFFIDNPVVVNEIFEEAKKLSNQYVWQWDPLPTHLTSKNTLNNDNNNINNSDDYTFCFDENDINNIDNNNINNNKKKSKFEDFTIILAGESHMRFNWDALVLGLTSTSTSSSTLNKHAEQVLNKLEKKHSDAYIGNVHFVGAVFVKKMAIFLDSICDKVVLSEFKLKFILVLQTGLTVSKLKIIKINN